MKLSIVVPAFNEQDNILPLIQAIRAASTLWPHLVEKYEIIIVDDGSTDATHARLNEIKEPLLTVIHYNDRRGRSHAQHLGMKAATYEIIATMDADLQNDPLDLAPMLEKIKNGVDFVVGWRTERRDPFTKKMSSLTANHVRRLFLNDPFHDINCCLRVFRKECIQEMDHFDGGYRFWPFIAAKRGFSVVEMPVRHHPRRSGRSKFGLWNRLFKTARDLVRVRWQYGRLA